MNRKHKHLPAPPACEAPQNDTVVQQDEQDAGGKHGHHEHAHLHAHPDGATHPEGSQKILTVRAISGLAGDMMLGGLAKLSEVETAQLQGFAAELNLPVLEQCVSLEASSVNAIAGWKCRISLPHEHAHRNLADIEGIICNSAMPEEAKQLSVKTFRLLAEAEAAVHGRLSKDVTFHEVGALDSILDICLVCRLFAAIKPDRFICSPLPLADGVIQCAHGLIPSPAPAVLRMLEGVPVCGFSGTGETVTPTALSLLKSLGAEFGSWPNMTVAKTAISYGNKIFTDAPNGALWSLGNL